LLEQICQKKERFDCIVAAMVPSISRKKKIALAIVIHDMFNLKNCTTLMNKKTASETRVHG